MVLLREGMAKAAGLIFSLFDIASALEVPFGVLQYVQWDLPVSSFVFHLSLLAVKSVNLVVACDGFLCITRIICTFHSGRGAFQTVLDLYSETSLSGHLFNKTTSL